MLCDRHTRAACIKHDVAAAPTGQLQLMQAHLVYGARVLLYDRSGTGAGYAPQFAASGTGLVKISAMLNFDIFGLNTT